jgi:hypothetical protein
LGIVSYFGTYSVNEEHRDIIMHVERSTFPNMNGTVNKRVVISLTADELKYANPATAAGRQSNFMWRRAQRSPLNLTVLPTR